MKFEHILLTTDLSSEAQRAFEPVADLARRLGARITLLYVVPNLTITPHGAPLAPRISAPETEEEIAQAKTELVQCRLRLPEELSVTTDVIAGTDLARDIAHYARQKDADLIALSTHGRSGFRRLIVGSVAEAVMRHAEVPVLCFPPPPE